MGGKAGEGCVWSRIAQRRPRQQHITARFIALANSFISNLECGYTIPLVWTLHVSQRHQQTGIRRGGGFLFFWFSLVFSGFLRVFFGFSFVFFGFSYSFKLKKTKENYKKTIRKQKKTIKKLKKTARNARVQLSSPGCAGLRNERHGA